MTCPTAEQLAAITLKADGQGLVESHVAACPRCQATLANFHDLHTALAADHDQPNRRHDAARAALLDQLQQIEPFFATSLGRWRRVVFGGLGLSTATAALVLIAVSLNSSSPLSAMERIMRAVREVRSYSFHEVSETTLTPPGGKPQRYHRGTYDVAWRAPDAADQQWLGDLHAEVKGWRIDKADDGQNGIREKLTLHLAETYPSGKPGIIIIFTEGYYFWVPPVPAGDLPVDNTIAKLRAVQQGQGRSVRELGIREIAGIEARGYVLKFGEAVPFRDESSIEVWIDPQTDLPLELAFERISDEPEGRYVDTHRLTDIRWNLDFPPNQFATVAPQHLVNTTPPTDEQSIAAIVDALKLYAELSGGHYPRIRTTDPGNRRDPENKNEVPDRFDAEQIRNDMLKFAGLTGPQQSDWSKNPQFQEIEAAAPALKSLAQILLDHHHAGFLGAEVAPHDKDKVLLWWSAGIEDMASLPKAMNLYRVFYGNLRTDTVSEVEFAKLVPTASFD